MSSVASTASHIADNLKDGASSARSTLADFGVQAMKMIVAARTQESRAVNSALGYMGLQRRQSALRPVLFFTAGAVVAGATALLLAPSSGKRLRSQLLDFLGVPKELEKRIDAILSEPAKATTTAKSVVTPMPMGTPRVVPSTHS